MIENQINKSVDMIAWLKSKLIELTNIMNGCDDNDMRENYATEHFLKSKLIEYHEDEIARFESMKNV